MVTSIPLSKKGKHAGKFETIVDDCDAEFLMQFNWFIHRSGNTCYAAHAISRTQREYMHRIILERMIERPLMPDEFPDHINTNSLDNRRENLRIASRSQNQMNRKKPKHNKSGYKGVHWDKRANKWRASIAVHGKTYNLGNYDDPKKAHEAYKKKAQEFFGDFANLGE